ncbi:uncharacterized membrane protein YjjP (DUF1212 family) [Bacteroides zoogleoformans]|uniref:Threonine/serine exporter n=1 Tax=Bacteroides zoogleoformans TaxID=28119 RepID=A0ABM6TAN6_9BACE|nr:threonine/serine exporter family protein [Bacteroides zoogleoformans]AVM53381.1 threonine/serine exporter [Bacteroides zoogleoformans]TWJ17290.1 uncharacterized membrane protein YjjP (DUF1212 family) [Bacteroides zoogleoformans]
MSEFENNVSTFLSNYATTLLECGATTARIEKNVLRMAEAYGCQSKVNIYPLHVEVVLKNDINGDSVVRSKTIRDIRINYNTISELSRLSWICFDQQMSLTDAVNRYEHITATARIPFTIVTLLTAVANASFCRLFCGDAISMFIVFIATACGFYIKRELCRKWQIDLRLSIIVAGCISAIMSCSGYVFSLGHTPDVALATSVLYLIPGIPYLNSVSDLINGHYICAMSRLIYSCVITVCLAVGLYIGLMMMSTRIM